MIAFDAFMLIELANPRASEDRQLKLRGLLVEIEQKRARIVIPTPALTEYLLGFGSGRDKAYTEIRRNSIFKIAPFADRACLECAIIAASARGSKKSKGGEGWQKAKFDCQILAIAKAEGVERLYTNDRGLKRLGEKVGVDVVLIDDMAMPASEMQRPLPLPECRDSATTDARACETEASKDSEAGTPQREKPQAFDPPSTQAPGH